MGALAIVVASTLWGTTGLAAHYAPVGSSPFAIGAGAMGLGGMLMTFYAHAGPQRRTPWGPSIKPLAWGALCLVIYPMCFYAAMRDAGIAVGTAVSIGGSPLMAMVIERVTGAGRLTPRKLVASALAVGGLVLLATLGTAHADSAPNVPLGVALGLAAALTYAGYSASAHAMMQYGCPSSVAVGRMFGVAALVLVPFFIVTGGPLLTEPRGWAVMSYLAVVPMALAYILFGYGLRTSGTSTAVTLSLVEPVVAATLAVIVVGEAMTWVGWLAMGIVLAGVVVLGLEGEAPVVDGLASVVPGEAGSGSADRAGY